jgi:hypothetical protein
MSDNHLTDEQVKIWRRVLRGMFGPYALLMLREDIEKFRDKLQADADKLRQTETEPEPTICTCDPAYIGTTTRRDGIVICHKCKRERKANE